MPLTLAQLRTVITRAEALEDVLETLESLGFNTTAWQAGSVQRTLLEGVAQVWASLSEAVDALSRLAFNESSVGDALTAFSASHYDNTRVIARATIGNAVLTGGAVGPPHAVSIGDLVIANAAGTTFTNTAAGVIPASGTLTLAFQCQLTGQVGNVANNTLTILQTPLAGVTVNNPDPGTGTWITTTGADAESDATLRLRNTSKWGVLSPSDPRNRYVNAVRTAVPTVIRVEVDDGNPDGPGTIRVYCADADGTSPVGDVTAVQTEMNRIRNPTAQVTALAAAEQAQAFVGTVFITTANNTVATQAAVTQALRDYVNGLPIGGDVFPGSPIGIFSISEALGAMTAVTGVRRVLLPTPGADVNINAHQVMTVASITFTFTSA